MGNPFTMARESPHPPTPRGVVTDGASAATKLGAETMGQRDTEAEHAVSVLGTRLTEATSDVGERGGP